MLVRSGRLPNVIRLAHAGLKVDDLNASAEFYIEKWGLEVADEVGGGLFLRSEAPDHHTLVLESGGHGLDHIAFEVAGTEDLDRAAELLSARDVPILTPPTSALEPGVARALRFSDPDGHSIELVAGIDRITEAYGPRDVKPQGVNHVVIRVRDLERSKTFYRELLGFRLSDQIGEWMGFMRCNANHHSLALVQGDRADLHHVAFDVRDYSDIATGVKTLGDLGVKRFWGPGRHGPGNNLFAYFSDPEGNVVEYTCDVQQVDEATWQSRVWPKAQQAADQWGTPPPKELG